MPALRWENAITVPSLARGRMVIPANVHHFKKRLEPIGIGIAARCKINAERCSTPPPG
jgi:thiamine biosynthesis protein ThiC